ncbi:MAG: hypothetical protein Q9213_007584 [Squamulea squamosa]
MRQTWTRELEIEALVTFLVSLPGGAPECDVSIIEQLDAQFSQHGTTGKAARQRIYRLIRETKLVTTAAPDANTNAATTTVGPFSIASAAGTPSGPIQPSAKKISTKRCASQGPESESSAKRAKKDQKEDSEHADKEGSEYAEDKEDVRT